jgi:alpha-tubulin suppressor-like RCC1 family protein
VDGDFGREHACVVLEDLRVACWGLNGDQQADPATFPRHVETPAIVRAEPLVPASPAIEARDVACGSVHSCVVLQTGALRCWGSNASGQIGDGTTTSRGNPTAPASADLAFDARSFVEVDSWGEHSCALDSTGEVWCWGRGTSGETGAGPSGTPDTRARRVGLPGPAVEVVASAFSSCARLVDGRVFCWGSNAEGVLGRSESSSGPFGPGAIASGPAAARRLVGGGSSFCVIDASRELWCWGRNAQGQLAPPATVTRSPVRVATEVDDVLVGQLHVCWSSRGEYFCRGRDIEGQRGLGSGPNYDTTTVVSPRVADLDGIIEPFSGRNTSCGVRAGELVCWGSAINGEIPRPELDLPAPVSSSVPGAALTRWASALEHACLVRADGVECVGQGGSGSSATAISTPGACQFGSGSRMSRIPPWRSPRPARSVMDSSIAGVHQGTCLRRSPHARRPDSSPSLGQNGESSWGSNMPA